MDDASKYAKNKLLAASRAKDRSRQIALACSIAAGTILILLAVALLDYWLLLPTSLRLGGVFLLAVVLSGGMYQLLKTFLTPTHLKEAALDAESERPDLGCELSTAAEYLAGDRKISQEFEAEMAAALEEKAARNLKQLELPYWKKPVRPALVLGVLGFAVLIFGCLASGAFTAFKRAAAPWSNAAYTQVEVKPGDVELPVGRDVEIKSVFSGRVPKLAQFEWQDSGSPKWQFASLTRTNNGEYIYPIRNIRTSLKYRVTGSDAVSPEFKVEPYTPPEVKDWRIELDLPAYTKHSKIVQTVPEITVLRGTVASFQISPSVKLSKARLRLNGIDPVDLKPAGNGFWKAELEINKDVDYWIELADEKGHPGGNEDPYHIKALADTAPKVEITEPGQDMRAEATNTIAVKISAIDDFGIQDLKLVYHKLNGPEQFVTATRHGETNIEFTTEIPLSTLDLKQYELVAYHAEAIDNNTLDGPGIGKSEVFFIEITSEEGAACKMPPAKSQKANLLVIQKQIVADTTALAANAPAEKFEDLAKRQKDAEDFGHLYLTGMSLGGAPAAATEEMEAAIRDMEKAQSSLEKHERASSLPPEESALARLYHILELMPELKDMPTVPKLAQQSTNSPVLQVVLDAIKKKKKEEPDNKDLIAALQEAKNIQQDQASLTIGSQNTGEGEGAGETKLDRSGKGPKGGSGKSDKPKAGEPKKGDPKDGDPKNGDAKNGDPKDGEPKSAPKEAEKLAEKENELSKETTALAEKLARMEGKDSRLGHGAAKKVGNAAAKMAEAAQAAGKGKMQSAGTKGAEAGTSLESAIALMERVLNGRPELADVSKEDFPKQYEAAIADYFKKLSHEE